MRSSVAPTDLCSAEMPWYVIHTCCHHEVRVEERLRHKGLEVFLPRYPMPSRRQDRKKILQVPLFPGYLFVRDDRDMPLRCDILKLPGVVRILANSSGLQPVPQKTIESIMLTLAGDRLYYPHCCLKRGVRVRVKEGPLTGVVGRIVEVKEKKRKVVVEVDLFQRAMAVELKDEAVEPWSP
jgi:transcription antitermination factor NusG